MSQPELEVSGKPNLQYEMGDLLLNVWVDFINGEWRVQGIALPNSQVDLQSMFSREQMRELGEYIDQKMPSAEEMHEVLYAVDID